MVPQVELFSFLFWRIEGTKKLLLRFTDLYYGINKSTGNETGKINLCGLLKSKSGRDLYLIILVHTWAAGVVLTIF